MILSIVSIVSGVLGSVGSALSSVFGPGTKWMEEEAAKCKANPSAWDCWLIGLTAILAPFIIPLSKFIFPKIKAAWNKDAEAAINTTAELKSEKVGETAAKGYRDAKASSEPKIAEYEKATGLKASDAVIFRIETNTGYYTVLFNLKEATVGAPDPAAANAAFQSAASEAQTAATSAQDDLKPEDKPEAVDKVLDELPKSDA